MLGVLESKRGNPAQAIVELRRAAQLNPHGLRAMYLLAQELERQGDPNSEAEFQQLLEQILVSTARESGGFVGAWAGGGQAGRRTYIALGDRTDGAHAGTWPPEVQPQWTALQAAVAGPDARAAAVRIAFLRNSLMRVPDFRQSLSVIQPAAGNEAAPFTRFLLLPSPTFAPPPADTAIRFHLRPSPIQALRKKPKDLIFLDRGHLAHRGGCSGNHRGQQPYRKAGQRRRVSISWRVRKRAA